MLMAMDPTLVQNTLRLGLLSPPPFWATEVAALQRLLQYRIDSHPTGNYPSMSFSPSKKLPISSTSNMLSLYLASLSFETSYDSRHDPTIISASTATKELPLRRHDLLLASILASDSDYHHDQPLPAQTTRHSLTPSTHTTDDVDGCNDCLLGIGYLPFA